MNYWLAALAYLAAINIVSVLAFFRDKRMAVTGGRRISEATLLLLALIGGGFGAKYAQIMFNHKTRKRPFKWILNLIVILNVVALPVLFSPGLRAQMVGLGQKVVAADWSFNKSEPEPIIPRRFGPGS